MPCDLKADQEMLRTVFALNVSDVASASFARTLLAPEQDNLKTAAKEANSAAAKRKT